MKKFRDYIKEAAPSNSEGNPQGYSSSAADGGPVAGFDKFLFPQDMDLLDQGYQTPGETGLAKWRFSNVYPVMKVTLDNNLGDGPSIDSMVDASREYTDLRDARTMAVVKKNLSRFMGEAKEHKECSTGEYYCHKDKKCKKIPSGYKVGYGGWLRPISGKNENGNGNGSHNGNGNGNGNGSNGNGGHGNGNGGNGGGNGGG